MGKKLSGFVIILAIFITSINNCAFADEIDKEEVVIDYFTDDSLEVFNSKVPSIGAGTAVIMDMKSGRVLYEKNAYSKRSIASTTKIMTAILAIEQGNLEDDVTISKRASEIWGSTINIREGQVYKLGDLLYGCLLASGNDAAIAIAEHIGGTVEDFAMMMTKKASDIGARNTSFKSPHGLDMEGHYSTAFDIALIARYALNNPTFSKIVGTKFANISNANVHNTNELLDLYPGADGVKTGYTGKAGRCLVSSATRDGWRLITVVLNCPSRTVRARSSIQLLNYAFSSFKPYTLAKQGESLGNIPVAKGMQDEVSVKMADTVIIPLRHDEIEKIEKRVFILESFEAPVYAGCSAGTVEFVLDGEVIGISPITIWSDVSRKNFKYYLKEIFSAWTGLMQESVFPIP